jgi:hypothetical protein
MSFTRLQPNDRNLLVGLNNKLCTVEFQLTAVEAKLTSLEWLLTEDASKMARIAGSANYTRTIAYYLTTSNVTSVIHTGTTSNGVETITETIAYADPSLANANPISVIYS